MIAALSIAWLLAALSIALLLVGTVSLAIVAGWFRRRRARRRARARAGYVAGGLHDYSGVRGA